MGKKYLETKDNSLEASVLNVWQKAVEQTKEIADNAQMYKNPEENTQKEEVDLDEGTIDKVKEIASKKQAMKIDGVMVDSFTASAISQIYDKVNDANKKKMEKLPITKLANLAFKMMQKSIDMMQKNEFVPEEVDLDEATKQVLAHGGKGKYKVTKDGDKIEIKFGGKVVGTADFDRGADSFFVSMKGEKGQKSFDDAQAIADYFAKNKITEEVDLDEARQLKDPKKEVMVVKGNKVVVIDKKDQKDYLKKGYKLAEASGDKEAYTKFFNSALKKFKVNSPAELKGDAKKKFYDYIDANWEGDNEKVEAAMAQVREFKIQGMKAALASIWNVEEGKNPFKVEDDKKIKSKNEKTLTGKKAAIINLKPEIKD